MSTSPNDPTTGRLGLWDAVSIIVGIIIGATIYETPPFIFGRATDPWIALGLWGGCGLLAFIGALCYAELATTYPRSGGDYNYLSRAYGPLVGYLFGWGQLAVVQTCSIGMMAYIFGHYTSRYAHLTSYWPNELRELGGVEIEPPLLYATAAVVVLTLLNIAGVVLGKIAQNLLTFAKVVGLGSIIFTGFYYPAPPDREALTATVVSTSADKIVVRDQNGAEKTFQATEKTRVIIDGDEKYKDKVTNEEKPNTPSRLSENDRVRIYAMNDAPGVAAQVKLTPQPGYAALALPLVFIFLAFGGWNDAAFVAAEVRNRNRNLPLALFIGVILVTAIYLAVNAAYVSGLGYDRVVESNAVASDVLKLLPGEAGKYGEQIICILVMVSALGAVNGLIFTSSRIYATLGADYSLLSPLGRWSASGGSPIWSLLVSMLVSVSMLWVVDTSAGKDWLDMVFNDWLGIGTVKDWGRGGFEPLLKCSAAVFWTFFLLSGLSVFVLRLNDWKTPRPFSVPLYPIVPLLFVAICCYMLYSSVVYAGILGLVGGGLVLLGLPLYVFSRRSAVQETSTIEAPKPVVPVWKPK